MSRHAGHVCQPSVWSRARAAAAHCRLGAPPPPSARKPALVSANAGKRSGKTGSVSAQPAQEAAGAIRAADNPSPPSAAGSVATRMVCLLRRDFAKKHGQCVPNRFIVHAGVWATSGGGIVRRACLARGAAQTARSSHAHLWLAFRITLEGAEVRPVTKTQQGVQKTKLWVAETLAREERCKRKIVSKINFFD